MGKDYYKSLGVDKNASTDEIKSAYRKLAKKYHTDANPGDKTAETKFKEVSEAYAVLSDPQKRATYDQVGSSAFDGSQGSAYNAADFDSKIYLEIFLVVVQVEQMLLLKEIMFSPRYKLIYWKQYSVVKKLLVYLWIVFVMIVEEPGQAPEHFPKNVKNAEAVEEFIYKDKVCLDQ